MLTKAQLALRRTGITATDMVVLAMGGDWHGRTPHDIYRAKVLGADDFRPTEAMQIGNDLEPVVLRRAAEKLGVTLRKGTTIRHEKHPRHLATPDGFGVGPMGEVLLQAKVVGLHHAKEWPDAGAAASDLPEALIIQCAWEIHVSGRPIDHPAALIGTEVRTYKIDRGADDLEDLIAGLCEIADRFLRDYVDTNRPPPIDGSEGCARMLKALWPFASRQFVAAPAEAEEWARRYFDAKRAIKGAEAEAELAKQNLVNMVGPNAGMKGDGWRLFASNRAACFVPGHTREAYRHFDLRAMKG